MVRHNIVQIFVLILITGLLVVGCSTTQSPATQGNSPTGNPTTTGTPEPPKVVPQQCKQAIDFTILQSALPIEIDGFARQLPTGSTQTFVDPTDRSNIIKYSSAEVAFQKNSQNIDIQIVDTCALQFLAQSWDTYTAYQDASGYMKQTAVLGYPAWKQHDAEAGTFGVIVIVNSRIIVSIQGNSGTAESTVDSAAKAVDYQTLGNAQ